MSKRQVKLTIPAKLLLLDLLGVALIGVGLYLKLSGDQALLPAALQFAQLPLVLIVSGGVLALPLVIFIINNAGKSSRKPRGIKGIIK